MKPFTEVSPQSDYRIDEFEALLSPVDLDETYLSQLFDIYHRRLMANPVACIKLHRRGITKEAIVACQIGLCDRTLNQYVKPYDTVEGGGFRGAMRRLGLTKKNGHELFRGCVVEPPDILSSVSLK